MTALPDLPDPVCESHIHEFGPFSPAPTATLWADWHGCADVFLCAGCINALAATFAKRAPLTCRRCEQPFQQLADFITWREL